jgi:hypothetical protein
MFCYSFLAMTAYNIVEPLAGGVFIAEFGAQNLPFMILVAGPRPAEPGDVTGLFEALAGQDGDASSAPRRLRVVRAGTALRIDRDDLYDLLGQRPNFLQQIFTAFFERSGR